jgi:hypothetical protein
MPVSVLQLLPVYNPTLGLAMLPFTLIFSMSPVATNEYQMSAANKGMSIPDPWQLGM